VLVRCNHVARFIVNANDSIMQATERLGLVDCVRQLARRSRLQLLFFAVRQLQHHRLSALNRHANVETLMGEAGGQ
jgi:hypothetical protein